MNTHHATMWVARTNKGTATLVMTNEDHTLVRTTCLRDDMQAWDDWAQGYGFRMSHLLSNTLHGRGDIVYLFSMEGIPSPARMAG